MLLGIGITELLLNLLPRHRFMKKPNSTVILNFRTCLIHNYLSKGFSIIEYNTKQFCLLPNDVKLRINLINLLDTDHVMVKNKAISVVANTIKQLNFQKEMHIINKKDFYRNNEKEIDDFFLEYSVSVMDDPDHPALV